MEISHDDSGVILLVMAFVYFRFTKDTPAGNFSEITRQQQAKGSFWAAASDFRTWILFLAYGACFGIEITFDNVAALYFSEYFKCDLATAGLLAGIFGFMNLFARAIGGIVADKVGAKMGMRGKGWLLAGLLSLEGIGIILFAQTNSLAMAVVAMLGFAFFLKMANGATYAIVPFIDSKNVGSVSGIVGAGGNLGGVLAGFLFKSENITYNQAFFYIGLVVGAIGLVVAISRFEKQSQTSEKLQLEPEMA
jgi:NNP family nitrate/nitrite transporter-like MFS transporter